jgi:hypothetical protein
MSKHQPEVKEAREYFKKTGNVDGALQQFPRYLTAERALVSVLWIHAHCYRGLSFRILLHCCSMVSSSPKGFTSREHNLIFGCHGFWQLTHLKRDSENYLQAINTIPRTLRLMYVPQHSPSYDNQAVLCLSGNLRITSPGYTQL